MPKNIVICCDGTSNQFSGDHTNVIRAYKVAKKSDSQAVFYDPGVGTMPQPWMGTQIQKRFSILCGLALATGLEDNIGHAYRYLMANYEEGDKVFLFGFSRGAFTARAVAALIHSVGLLYPGTENILPYALQYWQKDFGPTSVGGMLCREFKASLSRPCPIHFIGVWDTVSSVGYINHATTYPYTAHNPEVAHVRHTVSIDERRSTFRQNLMFPSPETPNQDIKNVWFAGVHSDVGGGYPPNDNGLAKISFAWMIREAETLGLEVDQASLHREVYEVGQPPFVQATVHRSIVGFWWLGELLPFLRYSFADKKRHWYWLHGVFNQPRDLSLGASESWVALHISVLERIRACPGYRPENLPSGEDEIKARFKIEE